ncbi:MAG: TRAP transporter large permease subunit [Thermoleophilia bacterium]|nr:TRAP transporter large permease subunit [Thermoleophilia bacterium]
MEWLASLLIMFGCLIVIMMTGMPICFAFTFTCIIGSVLFWGGAPGLDQLAMSFYSAVANYAFLPIPLFVLMGDVIFSSGAGARIVGAVDKLLGKVPGRLSLLAVGSGVLLGTMIGISGGSIGILGRVLVPEMEARGYKPAMIYGPIVTSGTLAILIPPSALAVFLGAIGQISVGKLLMAIIIPGVLLAILFALYIMIRCKLDPSLAPTYEVEKVSLTDKLRTFTFHILPIGIVILAVIGSIYLGVATPSEAAALGVLACFVLAAFYRQLSWKTVTKSAMSCVRVTVMVMFIVVGSISFSRILATTGAIQKLIDMATGANIAPIYIIIATQVILIFLGMFMDPASIVMITVPIFFPLAKALGYDLIWYGVVSLLNIQLGLISPPFGLDVYTMKAIAPPHATLGQVFRSSMPFFALGLLMVVLLFLIPGLATWLPSVTGK